MNPRKDKILVLSLCLVAACALVRAHTVSICYKLDQCTGQYEAAYGTYHSISEFSSGCPSNPSGKCPSGFSIIDGNSVPFTSLVLANSSGYPDEPGWDPSDCTTCPTYSGGVAGNKVWQKASVVLSPGSHTATVAATSAIESPWSGGCWPLTLNVGGSVSSSITCPASQAASQGPFPSCSSTASFSPASCSIDAATCPGFTCSVSQTGGPASGSTFPVGTTAISWLLNVNGNPTTQTCTHNVVFTDDTAPQNIACPSDVSATCNGPSGAIATWPGRARADDCSAITWSQSHTSGQLFPIGNTVVTYTATDAYSHTTSCTFNVTVGSGPPTWTRNCPADILATSFTPGPSGSTTVSWQAPLANDGCSSSLAVTQTTGPAPGSNFDVVNDNPTTITYQTAPDPVNGQQLTCSFVVSFGFARLTRIDQLGQLDVPRLIMYIPFDVTVAFVNIPIQSGAGRLWISDGTRQLNVPMNDQGQATFDTAALTNTFRGPYGLMPGQVTVWVTVDGNPFYFGNQITLELVAAY